MKEGQSSRTAEAAAALRANHFKNTTNPVFSVPYAFEMSSKGWKKLLSTPSSAPKSPTRPNSAFPLQALSARP